MMRQSVIAALAARRLRKKRGKALSGIRTSADLFVGFVMLAALALMAASADYGCGVKSAPVPPDQARPMAITTLKAASAADGIMLTWNRPLTFAGGHRMRDLGGFVIMRAEGETARMQPLVEIPVTDLERFQVEMAFSYDDQETRVGDHYRYAIISETTDGYRSDPSNTVEITRRKPPPPPNPSNFHLPTPSPLPS